MKTRELYSLVIKILGVVALLDALRMGFVLFLSGTGLIAMSFSGAGAFMTGTMGVMLFLMMFRMVLPVVVAYYCLARTEKILRWLNSGKDSQDEVNVDKKLIFNLVVLFFGLLFFLKGSGNVFQYDFRTSCDNQLINSVPVCKTVYSKSSNFNLFALIETITGVILLVKFRSIGHWLYQRFGESKSDQSKV